MGNCPHCHGTGYTCHNSTVQLYHNTTVCSLPMGNNTTGLEAPRSDFKQPNRRRATGWKWLKRIIGLEKERRRESR